MRISRTKLIDRKENVRDARLCIIAAEGAKTEAQYFAMFRNPAVKVMVLPTGVDGRSSPQDVFNRLERYKEQYDFGPKDTLWLMIDVDRWHRLAEICKEVKRHTNIRLAVSNPCFELWLWLHHADAVMNDTDCEAIEASLRTRLGEYNKSRLDFEMYKPHIDQAVRRAKALHTNLRELWPSFPGSHVYRVIESLPVPHG